MRCYAHLVRAFFLHCPQPPRQHPRQHRALLQLQAQEGRPQQVSGLTLMDFVVCWLASQCLDRGWHECGIGHHTAKGQGTEFRVLKGPPTPSPATTHTVSNITVSMMCHCGVCVCVSVPHTHSIITPCTPVSCSNPSVSKTTVVPHHITHPGH